MTIFFEDLLSYLESVIQLLQQLNSEEHIQHDNEDLAWERLSEIEELFIWVNRHVYNVHTKCCISAIIHYRITL